MQLGICSVVEPSWSVIKVVWMSFIHFWINSSFIKVNQCNSQNGCIFAIYYPSKKRTKMIAPNILPRFSLFIEGIKIKLNVMFNWEVGHNDDRELCYKLVINKISSEFGLARALFSRFTPLCWKLTPRRMGAVHGPKELFLAICGNLEVC